jgi:hypothetical protein
MHALLAALHARWRSWVGAILDRCEDLCVRAAHVCFTARQRITPTPSELTPELAEHIWTSVKARIEAEHYQPFQPTHADLICASLAEQGLVVRTIGSDGWCRARILAQPEGRS